MKNKQKSGSELDLFTPVVEIFHELCVLLFSVLMELGKFAFRKIMNQAPEMEKIERKALKVSRNTDSEDALGVDTRTKKEIKLDDIDFSKHTFIVGASGFGKTNLISILQENSLRNNKPIIFIDPKGDAEALDTFRQLCKRYDRTCYAFSEHDPDSISLNPILEGTESLVSDRIMGAFNWSEAIAVAFAVMSSLAIHCMRVASFCPLMTSESDGSRFKYMRRRSVIFCLSTGSIPTLRLEIA